MKIKQIDINSFKTIDSLSYQPKNKITVLTGSNGIGKTSFIEGLRTGILGNPDRSDVQEGMHSSHIQINFDDASGTSVERTIVADPTKPNKVRLNGKACQVRALETYLENIFQIPMNSMNVVTSSEVIANMTPSAFGDFLMGYIPEKVSKKQLLQLVPTLPQIQKAELEKSFPEEDIDMTVIKNIENLYREKNKTVKRELKMRKDKINAFVEQPTYRKLDVVEKELEDLIQSEGAVESSKRAVALYEQTVRLKEENEKEIEALELKIKHHKGTRINEQVKDQKLKEQSELKTQLKDIEKMILVLASNIKTYENSLSTLSKPVCPLSDKLVCATDKTKVKAELTDLLTSNKEGLEIQQRKKKELQEQEVKVQKEIDTFSQQESLYQEKLQLLAQLNHLKNKKFNLGTKPVEIKSKDFAKEKKALQMEKDLILQKKEFDKDYSTYLLLDEKKRLYQAVIDLLAPKGILREKVAEHYLGIFQQVCNDRASKINVDLEIQFTFDNGIQFLTKTKKGGPFLPFDKLSEGEKIITIFLILDMLNALTGLKILVLDNLDKLDEQNFSQFMKLLTSKEVVDAYDHIILAMVNHQETTQILKQYSHIDYIY